MYHSGKRIDTLSKGKKKNLFKKLRRIVVRGCLNLYVPSINLAF